MKENICKRSIMGNLIFTRAYKNQDNSLDDYSKVQIIQEAIGIRSE